MLATIYTIQNADFSGTTLPNIMPFTERSELVFAYDFRHRSNRLDDLSGNNNHLTAIRNDIAASIRTTDPTILKDAAGGQGVTVEMGYLDTGISTTPVNLETDEFTIMVIGGYSGAEFPVGKVAKSAPNIASLLDIGTGVSNKAFAVEYAYSVIGARISAYDRNMGAPTSNVSQKCAVFLTYKSGIWTMINKTTGATVTKTNAELGISGMLPVDKLQVGNIVIGHFHKTSTAAALYPTLFQLAKWGRALTSSEISAQYLMSKKAFVGVAI